MVSGHSSVRNQISTVIMKFLIVFAVAVACASADVSHIVHNSADAAAQVLRSESNVEPTGFQYVYETSNGIASNANGVLKNVGSENEILEVTGEVKFTADDGTPVHLTYVANENGFQPQGSHLPVAPPIPAAIQRSLEYLATHAPKNVENSQYRVAEVARPVVAAKAFVQSAPQAFVQSAPKAFAQPARAFPAKPFGRF